MWSLGSAMNCFVTIITKENQNQNPKTIQTPNPPNPKLTQNPNLPNPKLTQTQSYIQNPKDLVLVHA
jgi:hypothetical protein